MIPFKKRCIKGGAIQIKEWKVSGAVAKPSPM
jgi:hypothetical protein